MKLSELTTELSNMSKLKDFKNVTNKTLKTRQKLMQLFAMWISGNNLDEFIVEYLKNTNHGKRIFEQENESKKFGQVINRINFIHSSCPKVTKAKSYHCLVKHTHAKNYLIWGLRYQESNTQAPKIY